jgi:hypothetical protein
LGDINPLIELLGTFPRKKFISQAMSNSTVPGTADHNLYGYDPSKGAGYAYTVFFALVALAHFLLMFPLRAAFFIPLILGCAGEVLRMSSSQNLLT